MYKVYFYQDKNGKQPVKEYLDRLEKKSLKSKDARIKYNKFDQYIAISRKYGIAAGGGPFIKHLDGEIWELRSLRDRILFFAWYNDSFILLSCFMKNTKKHRREKSKKHGI